MHFALRVKSAHKIFKEINAPVPTIKFLIEHVYMHVSRSFLNHKLKNNWASRILFLYVNEATKATDVSYYSRQETQERETT
jgi:hypothetical protein